VIKQWLKTKELELNNCHPS